MAGPQFIYFDDCENVSHGTPTEVVELKLVDTECPAVPLK